MDEFNKIITGYKTKVYTIFTIYVVLSAIGYIVLLLIFWPLIIMILILDVVLYFTSLKEMFEYVKIMRSIQNKHIVDIELALEEIKTQITFLQDITGSEKTFIYNVKGTALNERRTGLKAASSNLKAYQRLLAQFQRLEAIVLEEVLEYRRRHPKFD